MTNLTLHQKLLLRDVSAGHVWHVVQRTATYDMNGHTGRRCTVRMRELVAAGWVELLGTEVTRMRYWRLTDAGQTMLDSHGGAP